MTTSGNASKALTNEDIALDIYSRNETREWEPASLDGPKPTLPPPISVRLSEPLLKAIDALAKQQDRRRTNLIQHILWEYVRANPIEPTV